MSTCSRRLYRLLAALALVTLGPVTLTVGAAATNGAFRPVQIPDFTAIDTYVEAQMQSARIPGVALAILQGDQIVYLKGYGVADPSGRAVTPQTPFLIASTVKPFTALAIMQLVEAGHVELDAPVQRYLPRFGFPVLFDAPRPRAYTPSGWTAASSAEDLAHFAIAQLNGGRYQDTTPLNVSPDTLAAMQQPAVRSYNDDAFYGLGWNVTTISGVPAVWAGGDAMNFKTRLLLAPEQRLAIVVLINMNSANVNSGRFELHRGVLSLLLSRPPTAVTPSNNVQLTVTMIVILLLSLLFVVGMIRSLLRLRRRSATFQKWRQDKRTLIASIGLPLALAVAWALLLMLGLPQVTGRSLPFLLLYVPDLGYMLIASTALALGWGLVSLLYR